MDPEPELTPFLIAFDAKDYYVVPSLSLRDAIADANEILRDWADVREVTVTQVDPARLAAFVNDIKKPVPAV